MILSKDKNSFMQLKSLIRLTHILSVSEKNAKTFTVDTRYLDILGTLQKMLRYPNVDINVDNGKLTNSVCVTLYKCAYLTYKSMGYVYYSCPNIIVYVDVINSFQEIVCLIIMKHITIYFKSKMSSNRDILLKKSPIFTPLYIECIGTEFGTLQMSRKRVTTVPQFKNT